MSVEINTKNYQKPKSEEIKRPVTNNETNDPDVFCTYVFLFIFIIIYFVIKEVC